MNVRIFEGNFQKREAVGHVKITSVFYFLLIFFSQKNIKCNRPKLYQIELHVAFWNKACEKNSFLEYRIQTFAP